MRRSVLKTAQGLLMLVSVACLLAAFSVGQRTVHAADVLHVPGNAATIQAAIDLARSGDTIIVAPGTYRENLDFQGKGIFLMSSDPSNPDVVKATIIDGGGAESVINTNGARGAVIAGFTITNGSAQIGGGIRVSQDSTATIRNNVIVGNRADDRGGGIMVQARASAIIEGNTVTENSSGNRGGGIHVQDCEATIIGNQVFMNKSAGGGGIAIVDTTRVEVRDNIIRDNTTAPNHGGGILIVGRAQLPAGAVIMGNTFEGNRAGNEGGAIFGHTHTTILNRSGEAWPRMLMPECWEDAENTYRDNTHKNDPQWGVEPHLNHVAFVSPQACAF